MTVGLYCLMSVVFNAVTASQLKRVNNFIGLFTDIVTYQYALSKVAFSFLVLFSATYMYTASSSILSSMFAILLSSASYVSVT